MGTLTDQELNRQLEILSRGAEAMYTREALGEQLKAAAAQDRPLRVKLGLDPTAPDIHLGHTVPFGKVRQFQDLGHKAVIIVGDYTARIGDPSGANKTRPMLSGGEIDANAATYIEQAGKVLDTSQEKLEIRRNSEWLADLKLADILKLMAQTTVARMLERDTFELRYKNQVPIGLHEFLYPLIQGYDSICIEADVEIGGTDQTFNNLMGRQLQENAGMPPHTVVIMPLLVGLDGQQKMSKSKNNYIGITDEPNDMFGKVMSVPDELMENYFTLLTDAPREEIAVLVAPDQTHPRDAKAKLGRLVVAKYHGEAAAEEAANEFDRIFAQKQVPQDMPELKLPGKAINIVEMIVAAGFAKSKGEARRLVQQNAVSIDDQKITDIGAQVEPADGQVLRVGKRRFAKLCVS